MNEVGKVCDKRSGLATNTHLTYSSFATKLYNYKRGQKWQKVVWINVFPLINLHTHLPMVCPNSTYQQRPNNRLGSSLDPCWFDTCTSLCPILGLLLCASTMFYVRYGSQQFYDSSL